MKVTDKVEIRARIDAKVAKRAKRIADREPNEKGGTGVSLNVFLVKSVVERIARKAVEAKDGEQTI